MLDLHSLIWGFGESNTIVHDITSDPVIVFSYVLCSSSIDIRKGFQPFGCNLARDFVDVIIAPRFRGQASMGDYHREGICWGAPTTPGRHGCD